jgi:hypothetical protein
MISKAVLPSVFQRGGRVGTENIITSKKWPKRESLIPWQKNVVNTPFVKTETVYLTPQHIKFGLIKKFRQGNDQSGAAFMYLKNKSPRRSDAKIKERVFVGPQIRQLNRT